MTTPRRSLFAAAVVTVVLVGCGGGGGGGGTPVTPTPPPVGSGLTCTGSEAFSAVADATVAVGKAAGAVVAGCSGALTDVQWTQTAGPSVSLLSARTQAISFEPATAGTYTFVVRFRDAAGVQQSATVNTTAVPPSAPVAVLARVDQAVRKGGNVSLRAWPAVASGETLTWTQTAGPQVTLDTSDPNRVLFVAPEVSRDTALGFRVTRRTAAGTTDSDDVMVLVENYAQAPSDPANSGPYVFSDTHVARVYPYRANGPYAASLVRCTYDAGLQYFGSGTNTCSLATLPFLHQTTGGAVPTVSQVMDRVLVSHDWMGQVFEEFLTTQSPDDLKRLFNGVTAIVIGAHVRPSFYYALTGAIYLDADNFWLTAEQRDVINETPDYRIGFDRDLLYSTAWRYTSTTNGTTQSIFVNFPETSRISRTQSYLMAEAGWLLYHELAHASDFLPPSERSRLNADLSKSAWGFIGPIYSARSLPSDRLSTTYPLLSQEMLGLAQVKYQGATASDVQKTYTPDMVAGFFAGDRATDDYNYTTTREDAAMLFEEFMMFRNHAWRRDFAVTDKRNESTTSDTLIVRWGQRGRVGESSVKPRAQLIVGQLAPWVLTSDPSAVTNLPAPLQMRPGDSWKCNLTLPGPCTTTATIKSLRTPPELEAERAMLLRDVGRPHGGTPNDRLLRRFAR